jgi:hypothetical protein
MSREPLGPVGHSILEKYQVLIEETVPAYKKRIAELEKEVKRLQPKPIRQQPKRK